MMLQMLLGYIHTLFWTMFNVYGPYIIEPRLVQEGYCRQDGCAGRQSLNSQKIPPSPKKMKNEKNKNKTMPQTAIIYSILCIVATECYYL